MAGMATSFFACVMPKGRTATSHAATFGLGSSGGSAAVASCRKMSTVSYWRMLRTWQLRQIVCNAVPRLVLFYLGGKLRQPELVEAGERGGSNEAPPAGP
jgi:hypothetical protein